MKLLLIDFSNTLIRSMAVHGNLSHEGVVTGGLYGIVSQMTSKILSHDPDHIIVCCDTKPYLRKEFYPQYKENRPKIMQNEWGEYVSPNMKMTKDFFRLCNIPIWEEKGWEADDLIALLTHHYQQAEQIYILSNDDDLFQLLTHSNVTLLRNSQILDQKEFIKKHSPLQPEDWVLYTALQGTHNNVTGLDRCGPKTALKYIMQKKRGLNPQPLLDHEKLIARNVKLISLPYNDTLAIPDEIKQHPQFNKRPVIRYLHQYGIEVTLRMDEAFSKYHKFSF